MSSFLPTFQSASNTPSPGAQSAIEQQLRLQQTPIKVADGDLFLRNYLYYFELRLPPSTGATQQSYFFPLILNPESLSMTEPFSVEVAMTQNGGLFVEENGIVQRSLRIRGNPGWQPKNFPKAMQGNPGAWQLVQERGYSRNINPSSVTQALSGMRHLEYLQDCVFRTYSDFKSNPATADGTVMIWHDVKLEEHWIAVPRTFSIEQSSERPFSYTYDIELLLVGKAEASTQRFSNDELILKQIKQPQDTAQSAIDKALGALQDLTVVAPAVLAKVSNTITTVTSTVQAATALESQLKSAVLGFGVIVGNVNSLIAAASDFVSGATALIESPFSVVKQTIDTIETGLAFYANLQASGASIAAIPDALLQSMRQLGDSLDLLGLHPESFRTSAQDALQNIAYMQNLSTANTADALAAAANAPAPATYDAVNNIGTGLMPGDQARASGESTLGQSVQAFTAAQKYIVKQGDTLASIAAKYLGDARLWQYIAAANGLKPPFVVTTATTPAGYVGANGLSGALTVGETILVPNYALPPEAQPNLPVLGVLPTEDADVHLLGRDMALAPVGSAGPTVSGSSNALLDLVVDTAHGSNDFLTVAGVPNLAQGLTTRVLTERGSDVLYQDLGMQPVVGLGVTAIDIENMRFRVQEALANDPRVASVQRVAFASTNASPDAVAIDATVQVRGFAQPSNIQIAT